MVRDSMKMDFSDPLQQQGQPCIIVPKYKYCNSNPCLILLVYCGVPGFNKEVASCMDMVQDNKEGGLVTG